MPEPTIQPGKPHAHPQHGDALVLDFPVGQIGAPFAVLVAILVPLVFVAIFLSLFLRGALGKVGASVGGGIIVGLSVIAFLWPQPRLAALRLRHRLRVVAPPDTPEVPHGVRWPYIIHCLRDVASVYGQYALAAGGRSNPLRIVARELAETGSQGMVFRLTSVPTEAPPLPEPLEVPIEPVPLSDARESFVDLRGERVTAAQRVRSWWTTMRQVFAHRRGLWYFMLVTMMLGSVVLAIQTIIGFSRLFSGRVSQEIWLALALVVWYGGYFLWRSMRPDRWFLVPGGVIVIDPNWLGKAWRADLIRRDDAVLLYWMQGGQAVIATPNAPAVQRRLTPWEFEMLARVWRSPLPPPPEEQVQALVL